MVQLTRGDGNVVKRYEYDAFGNEANPDTADSNAFSYCGEYLTLSSYKNMSVNVAQFPVEVSYTPTNNDPMIVFIVDNIGEDNATVTLQITANENSIGQIFWRTSEGSFNEANSKKFAVAAGTNQYTVELGQVFAGALRLDVGVNGSPVTLRNIKLVVDKNLSGVSYKNMTVNVAHFPVEVAYTPTNNDPQIEFYVDDIEGDYPTVTLQITANENSTGQIFWRTTEGSFSEANSKKFIVAAGTNQYTVELGQVFAGALRLDVGVNGSPVTLRNIKLKLDTNPYRYCGEYISLSLYYNMNVSTGQFPTEVSYTPTNNDPQIEFYVDDIGEDNATVTLQITANENSTGQIYWRTAEGSFSGAYSKRFSITAGTNQYTVELGQVFGRVIRLDVGVNGSPVTLRNIKINSNKPDTNPFRYCGEYFDKETGTYYLRARYYDPEIGRFISEDSVWGKDNDPLSLNLYTYCSNNPIMYFDPSGHIVTGWDTLHLGIFEQLDLSSYSIYYEIAQLNSVVPYLQYNKSEYLAEMNYWHKKAYDLRMTNGFKEKDTYDYTYGGTYSGRIQTEEHIQDEKEIAQQSLLMLGPESSFLGPEAKLAIRGRNAVNTSNALLEGTNKTGLQKINLQLFATQDRDMIDKAAKALKMGNVLRREFGDFVEEYKHYNGIASNATLPWKKLIELGKEFKRGD